MDKEVFLALESGVLAHFQSLYQNNPNVLVDLTFKGNTPLHIAAREGHLPLVEWILQVKPSLARVRNKDENTPLHEAAKCGSTDVVRVLLQHRENSAYEYNKFVETAMIIASNYGHLDTVKLLCEGRVYNDKFETRRSIRVAAYKGYEEVAKAILNNPTQTRWFRWLWLFFQRLLEMDTYADLANFFFGISLIVKFVSLQFRSGYSPLHAAVHGGNVEIVSAVLNSCEWNKELMGKKDRQGRCAIHVAAMKGYCDIIGEFMFRWPDCVEIRSSDEKSALHLAVDYNQFEVVRSLLFDKSPQKVAELVSDDRDCFHNTALHLAVRNGVDYQLVEYLVSIPRVDVNAVNEEGMTALDIASAAAKDNTNCAIMEQKLDGIGGLRLSLMKKSDATSGPSNASIQVMGDKNIMNAHMVVASLIATVTFAAMFQIPGGPESNDQNSVHYGAAKMAFRRVFKLYIFSDTAAFCTSLTVVAAWLVRQLFGDTDFETSSVTSHISVVTLLFSMLWTIVAFVCATIVTIIPANYDDLKRKDKKVHDSYEQILINENLIATLPPLNVCLLFLVSVSRRYGWGTTSEHAKQSKIGTYYQMCVLTISILCYALPRSS